MAGPSAAGGGAARRLLILGGTGEAAELAAVALARFGAGLDVVTSLAGRIPRPGPVAGRVRVGGFGGAEGLARYLRDEGIDLVVDATHPFAAGISAHARTACGAARVPRLTVTRPAWPRTPQDRWIEVPDMAAAAKAVGRAGRRAFLTVGAGEIAAFAGISGVWLLVRLMAEPREALPLGRRGRDYELIVGRGPFTLEGERRLLAAHRIDVLVSKASGGAATEAKIVAARQAGLPVILVRRPPPEPGERAETIPAALDWLARALERLDESGAGGT
jgi:precorrin-6A/cobalt-precorrin-6A reductase